MSWNAFLRTAPPAGHAVQVYDDVTELAESVCLYLDAGFRAGEPAVVIASADHRQAFLARLDPLGPRGDLLTLADAEEVLESLLEGESPSAERFELVVGGMIDDVAARFPGRTVRAFGEMVDLLWHRGNESGAIALEDLWNSLLTRRRLALLCGYRLDIFDLDVQTSALPAILRAHSHPRTAADTGRLAAAVDEALTQVLGAAGAGDVYLRVAERVPRTELPRAQAVLTWLSGEDSPTARRVLARARDHYAGIR